MRLLIILVVGCLYLCTEISAKKPKQHTQGEWKNRNPRPQPALSCRDDSECMVGDDHPCKRSACRREPGEDMGMCYSWADENCPTDDGCPPNTYYCPSNWKCYKSCERCPHFELVVVEKTAWSAGQCAKKCPDYMSLCPETRTCVDYCDTDCGGKTDIEHICREYEAEPQPEPEAEPEPEPETEGATTEIECPEFSPESIWMKAIMTENVQRYALALQLVYKTPKNLPNCAVTLLAPTDDAFAKLPEETYNALFTDMDLLKKFVELTIIPDEIVMARNGHGDRTGQAALLDPKTTLADPEDVVFFVKSGEWCVGGPEFSTWGVNWNVAVVDTAGIVEAENGNLLPISDILIPMTEECYIAPGWKHPGCVEEEDPATTQQDAATSFSLPSTAGTGPTSSGPTADSSG